MLALLLGLFGVSCGYQLFATWCSARFSTRPSKDLPKRTKFSQVKPLREPESQTLEALDSFWAQSEQLSHDFYLCSTVDSPQDWLQARPHFTWLKVNAEQAANGKAATLARSQKYWSGDIFIISDADMQCDAGYLQAVLGEFSDPEVGVVTCLYRAASEERGPGGILESLFILDFAASVLVAERTEGVSFAMGSTMAIRREALEQIGGFEALEPYLADDFQLGYRASRAGWKVRLAPTVMETGLGQPSLSQALSHQFRWMVTARVSRPGGHFAYIVTQGLVWALAITLWNAALGAKLLLFWSFLRIGCGSLQSRYLKTEFSAKTWWQNLLRPLKDLIFLGVWAAASKGRRVRWGDQEIEVGPEGKIAS